MKIYTFSHWFSFKAVALICVTVSSYNCQDKEREKNLFHGVPKQVYNDYSCPDLNRDIGAKSSNCKYSMKAKSICNCHKIEDEMTI